MLLSSVAATRQVVHVGRKGEREQGRVDEKVQDLC